MSVCVGGRALTAATAAGGAQDCGRGAGEGGSEEEGGGNEAARRGAAGGEEVFVFPRRGGRARLEGLPCGTRRERGRERETVQETEGGRERERGRSSATII